MGDLTVCVHPVQIKNYGNEYYEKLRTDRFKNMCL